MILKWIYIQQRESIPEFHNGVRFADDLVQVFHDIHLVRRRSEPSIELKNDRYNIQNEDTDNFYADDDDTIFYGYGPYEDEPKFEHVRSSSQIEDEDEFWRNYANVEYSQGWLRRFHEIKSWYQHVDNDSASLPKHVVFPMVFIL